MISRGRPITSTARLRPPTPGWPSMACSRARFPTRCGRTATERPYAALQKRRSRSIKGAPTAPPTFFAIRCHFREGQSVYRVALVLPVGLSWQTSRQIWLRHSMDTLLLPFSPRYIILTICAVVTALLIGIGIFDHNPKVWEVVLLPIVIFGALTLLGIRDLTQKSHAVLRNYPISAHIRFLLEEIRPEMRQYFFESEKDGMPFSRDTRALVYQRAKIVLDKRPFGTQEDVYKEGYEWMHHSVAPKPNSTQQVPITIGCPDCTKPYSSSVFN